jgi:RNA polymerase sigma factor (sigma-70 family)
MTTSTAAHDALARLAAGGLRAGPDEAWLWLEAAWRPVERFVRARLLSRHLSAGQLEDCGQNVFVRVWQFRSSYRGTTEAEFWRWLTQICDNERRRLGQREGRRAMASLPLEDEAPPGEQVGADAADAANRREELAAVRLCLDELDDKRRRVLELVYFDPELPERAIAELLECSPANVHKLKVEGLRLIQACLGRKGIR